MLKHFIRTLTVTVLFSLATILAYAQSSDVPKVEVGAQFAVVRLRDLNDTNSGAGFRLGFNITNSIAAEGEFNYFGGDLKVVNTTYSNDRKEVLFGVKYIPLRGDKFGIGGKVRPGFVRFGGNGAGFTSFGCVAGAPTNTQSFVCAIAGGTSNFAMDFGGVFEYYPTKHAVVRFDLGDTIIRFKGLATDSNGNTVNGFTSNNLQFNIGIGFRF